MTSTGVFSSVPETPAINPASSKAMKENGRIEASTGFEY
jgi:hypothetical protein